MKEMTVFSSIKSDDARIYEVKQIADLIKSDHLISATQAARLAYNNIKRAEKDLLINPDAAEIKQKIKEYKDAYNHTRATHLPIFVASGEFKARGNESLIKYNGNVIFDIDAIKNEKSLVGIRTELKTVAGVLLLFVSPSGAGIKVVMRTDYKDQNPHEFHAHAFRYITDNILNPVLKKYNVKIDESGKDISRVCYLCRDDKIYFNEDAIKIDIPEVITKVNVNVEQGADPELKYYNKTEGREDINVKVIDDILKHLARKRADITGEFHDWMRVLYALKNCINDDARGLDLFKQFSQYYSGYNESETERKWNEAKARDVSNPAGLGTLIYLAKEYGYIPSSSYYNSTYFLNSIAQRMESEGIFIRNNILRRSIEIKRNDYAHWQPCTQLEFDRLQEIQFGGHIKGTEQFIRKLRVMSPEVNEIREFFNAIPEWNGEDVAEQLFKTLKFKNEQAEEVARIFFKKFFIAALYMAYSNLKENQRKNDRTENEGILVLRGAQGIGKTSWVRKLLPLQFHNIFITEYRDIEDVDVMLAKEQNFYMFFEEGGIFDNKNEAMKLKRATSMRSADVREKYGRQATPSYRNASYVTTLNNATFITDITGSRRFYVLDVAAIDYKHKIDMMQFYAQMYNEMMFGERTYLDYNEQKIIEDFNRGYNRENAIVEVLEDYFEPTTDVNEMMTTNEIKIALKNIEKETGLDVRYNERTGLKGFLESMKYEYKQQWKLNGKRVWDISFKNI